jgi:dihydropteroate synthase-like protein
MFCEEIIMGAKKIPQNNKILALTGRLASDIVKQFLPENAELLVLPVNVAAFITSDLIKANLPKEKTKNYDFILAPGLIQEDLTALGDYYDIPVVKGPKYASDIKITLKEINQESLSPKHAADKFLKDLKRQQSQEILESGFQSEISSKENEFSIGQLNPLPIGLERPPLVMAEIVDATKLTNEEIISRAMYYIENGVDVIDIGAVASKPNPKRICEIIKLLEPLREKYPISMSIDTLNTDEIKTAIQNNIDLILSIDHSNIDSLIDNLRNEIGLVIVPTDVNKGYLPRETTKRINSLLTLRDRLKESGLSKIFVDPIIEMPIYPGFVQSLNYYVEYRKKDPVTPMMTCIGNVTEFIAADPVGINALFGCIAVELGIQLLLVTDVSIKCRGGIKEVVTGRNMAYIAQQKKAPPKGIGINLLMAKSRIDNDLTITNLTDIKTVECSKSDDDLPYGLDYTPDSKGSFTIWIDYHKQKIFVIHLKYKTNKPTMLLSASKARPIFEKILEEQLVSHLDHAYYLGRELERAEICLYLGKTYIQNEQVFKESNKLFFEK